MTETPDGTAHELTSIRDCWDGASPQFERARRRLDAIPRFHQNWNGDVGQVRTALQAAYPGLPFLWLDREENEGEVFALDAQDLASI